MLQKSSKKVLDTLFTKIEEWKEAYREELTQFQLKTTKTGFKKGAIFFQKAKSLQDVHSASKSVWLLDGVPYTTTAHGIGVVVVLGKYIHTQEDIGRKRKESINKLVDLIGKHQFKIPTDFSKLGSREQLLIHGVLMQIESSNNNKKMFAVDINLNTKLQGKANKIRDAGKGNITSVLSEVIKPLLNTISDNYILILDHRFSEIGWHYHLVVETDARIEIIKECLKPIIARPTERNPIPFNISEAYFIAGKNDYAMKFVKPRGMTAEEYKKLQELYAEPATGKRITYSKGMRKRHQKLNKQIVEELTTLVARYDFYYSESSLEYFRVA